MTTRFPQEYHGRFEVVNMRFLVYGMKELDLQNVVEHVAEILRESSLHLPVSLLTVS